MKLTLPDRLLRRELGDISTYSSPRGLYGDRAWIDDLDIVNELGGHTGCVNALSWSSSGRLLASGSDDQHINIHSYQPDSCVSPFALTTTLSTGHGANIFSVKFMPYSGDRILVSAAGDSQVRVFDIEHSGRNGGHSVDSHEILRGTSFRRMYRGVRYLSRWNTQIRVYKSHADRVKRIVTESSPNVFLTCSEDGEVRQFDIRMPSSAYPPPTGGRVRRADHDDLNGPPPLISYKRFNLDLNTISCSPSQPHYIALGGAHLHCFLHDRRMLGRNIDEEQGNPGRVSPANSMSSAENDMMGLNTRCVRKFAPEGRKKMRRTDNGHITACKISDANPNEMIVSWSGDNIYSFDLVRSPDASEQRAGSVGALGTGSHGGKVRESGDRKRKRTKDASTTSPQTGKGGTKPRGSRTSNDEDANMALRVRYENGQSEDIAMSDVASRLPPSAVVSARESVLDESQLRSSQIAKSCVKIRSLLFSLSASTHAANGSLDLDSHVASFTSVLGFAARCVPEMDEISRSWRYPVNPLEGDIVLQQTLRGNRDSSRRFVQAAGTLARLLGGRLQTASRGTSPALDLFRDINPAPHEGPSVSRPEMFCYDFLKAIVLWIEGGKQALLQGFKRPPSQRKDCPRFPIADEAQLSSIDDILIPYLLDLAGESAIPNVDASRFERDETRIIFETETAAVIAFSNAIRMPLEDLSRAIMPASESQDTRAIPVVQDRKTALKYWAFKVGRGILMNAGNGVNFQFVDTAFGGLGASQVEEGRSQEDIDPDEEDDVVEAVRLVNRSAHDSRENRPGSSAGEAVESEEAEVRNGSPAALSPRLGSDIDIEDAGSDAEAILMDDLHDEIAEHLANEAENENEGENNDDDENDEESDADDDNGDITAEERLLMFQSASDRGRLRESVENNVPCSAHTRQYRGHCNVKTVKDANFFGLQDEYVVSGSDGGHLFIWDKKTSELINILEGDSEVVNVVQGKPLYSHPYEPVLAVSGIDNTIKIFSPDNRAREDAEAGTNIGSASLDESDHADHLRGRFVRHIIDHPFPTGEGLSSRKRMRQSYQITSQNDVQRRGGMRDAYITRSMLAQLSARLRARQGTAGDGVARGGVVVGEDGETVIMDENCAIM